MKNYLYLFTSYFFLSHQGVAQISISYPLENCVFQRDQNNRAKIYLAGNFTEFLDVVEVRLTPVQEGWGQASDWIGIHHAPRNGYYSGNVEWPAGWYRVEVRGKKGDQTVGTAAVSKVGIGEVFLVAGQSNGQGLFGNGAVSANDQRVVHVDYNGVSGPNAPLPYPNFSQLQADDVIAPRGKSAWLWGPLGDAIANRLNVPVLFYNVAWDGSGIKAWQQSISGTAWSAYVPDIPFEPSGMPYGNLRNVMRNYVSITGLRAILWLQGEADNDVGTSSSEYYATLESVINQTRNEFNRNISWVVSRTSYTIVAGSGQRIIDAQNQIIQNIQNVFAGPEMDKVQVPRPDGYHLSGNGLAAAAVAWNASLNSDFFARSVPHLSKPPINISASCEGSSITVHAEGGLNNYRWNNGSNSSNITPGEGLYQLSAFDGEGNYRFSPRFRIPGNTNNLTPPTVSSEGPAEVCNGGSLKLRSSSNLNPVWNTGANGTEISVSSPGTYQVSIENPLGCRTSSQPFVVARSSKPLPPPPTISANRATEICDGEEVILSSSTGNNTFWSTGATNQSSATIRNSGEYTATTRDAEGCFSENSNRIGIQVNALPAKPLVSATGATVFCAGGEVTLRSSYQQGNTWSNNTTDQSIVVRQSGNFSVSIVDAKGCRNTSDAIQVTVNALPAAPVISSLRPLSFCQGDYTTLTSNSQHIMVWSEGSNNQQINLSTSGEYWAEAVDQNGCRSPISNRLTVTVNPLPARPVIKALGNTTFCENDQVELEAPEAAGYLWSNGETKKNIEIHNAGNFTLQTINQFGCKSPASASIRTQTLPIPARPTVSAAGPTDICDNDQVVLTARGAAPFLWNTEVTNASITAREAGLYSARSVGSNGCFSNPSNPIEVVTYPTPDQPVLQKNGSFSLRVSNHVNGIQYNWLSDTQPLSAEQDYLIRIAKSGEYSAQAFVQYAEQLTCRSDFSDATLFAIDENERQVNVFPNPSRGATVWVESASVLTNASITVYTLQGKVVGRQQVSQMSVPVEIQVPTGTSGILIIRVEAGNFNVTEKLVVLN